jgi:hypothetical protein
MMSACRPTVIPYDVGGLSANVRTIGALARLQLMAKRLGFEIRLRDASHELLQLVDLAGLGDVLRVEAGRQPEEREDALGVEEERELRDPPV